MRRVFFASSFVAIALAQSLEARGQSSGADVALSEVLYRQGRKLMTEGKVAEACPKFAESYRLDAATGTLLNLAACHEAEQRLATAWLEYLQGLILARRDRRDDRVRFAEARLAAIEPRLSRLTVVVSPGIDVRSLEIRIDEALVGVAGIGIPTPVDRGEHTVTAQAPGRPSWSQRVAIQEDPTNVTVTIPPLERLLPASTEPASVDSGATRPVTVTSSARPVPTSVYALGSTTLLIGAASIGTGITYLSHLSAYNQSHEESDYEQAHRWGVVNDVLWGATALAAGATAYLYLTRPVVAVDPRRSTGRASTVLLPWAGVSSAGLLWQGAL
jgi:hypothetical protein